MLRGETGIGERGSRDGIQTVGQRDEMASGGYEHELGHAPVQAEATAASCRTIRVGTGS